MSAKSNPTSEFVHLHVHTQYSLLDGAIRPGALFERVKAFGMEAVAITDHGTMFGVLDFYQQARKAGIKPVIGCECYVAPRTIQDKTAQDKEGLRHLVLLAENREGYENLCRLATLAQLEGFYYKPRIDKELLKAHSSGLIALSACLHGEIPELIKQDRLQEADEAAMFYAELFGENNFFLEVQHNGIGIQEKVNQTLCEMSQRLSLPLVATNDCHYLDKADARAHEVLLCVQTQKTIHDADRFQFETDQLYLKSPDEMAAYFGDYPGALANTAAIAERCNLEFDFSTYHFPQFDPDSEKSPDDLFDLQVREGYARRMAVLKAKNPDLDEAVYTERLEYELKTIKDMGFPGYFLIVADFIRYAKENGIPVGPGRGSAAGSLVSYALGITDLDPIAHGLIFERFLNPARISMPDIDVDFCINGRERVFKYVVERYGGGDYVAQIITFGKMKTRAVIRDVGRALGISLHEVDAIAKLVPDDLKITLDKALKKEPRLADRAKADTSLTELIEICRTLEGLPRHASTHAAGVVIGDKPLVEYLPLYKGKKGEVVTQFDMKLVEKIGLVKFDFLGLRNLTVIDSALKLIARQGKTPPDLASLPLNDPDTFKLLQAGDTTGVFQLESTGIKDLMVRMRPENFDDLTALVALYRPGPLDAGMVDDYVERKHGRKAVEYLVPEFESVLKETYGVMVYQEQVMNVAGVLANYTMAEADGLRKAIGKKIPELMAEHRQRFVQGSVENGIPQQKATELFDMIEKFGGYGFNKSHSAAYALIAYHTAYLKAHFPVEFMAALLTSEMNSIDGVVKFIAECKSHDIVVLPPDINESKTEFSVVDGKIRFGLVAVKNVGQAAIDLIIRERKKGGRFESIFDFCQRVDCQKVNKRVLESLIRCGAFDSTGMYRSRLMTVAEDALEHGQRIQKEKADPQMSLFGGGKSDSDLSINLPAPPEIDEWDDRLKLAFEKEALGFYITGHPLDRYKTVIEQCATADTLSIKDKSDGSPVQIGGAVKSAKTIRTRKNELMAFVEVEDMKGTIETVVFPSVYAEAADLLAEDNLIFVRGKVQQDEKVTKIIADKLVALDKVEVGANVDVHFELKADRVDKEAVKELRAILARYPGNCRGLIHIKVPGDFEAVIGIADVMRINASSAMIQEVNGYLGYDSVSTEIADP